jgi:ribosomal protein L29
MKANELKNLTPLELRKELEKVTSEYAALRMKVRLNQAKNYHVLQTLRKTAARIHTILKKV